MYQQIIIGLLEEYSAIPPSYPTDLRDEVVADTIRRCRRARLTQSYCLA